MTVQITTFTGARLIENVARLEVTLPVSSRTQFPSTMCLALRNVITHPHCAYLAHAAVATDSDTHEDIGLAMLVAESLYSFMVTVSPKHRRQGIASKLVETLLPFAAGWHRQPRVWVGNVNAWEFWENFKEKVRYQ